MVNGKKFQSQTVTLSLIGQCPMSNSSKDFSYPTIYSNFKILDHLFFELSCLETDRQTDTRRQVLYTCRLDRKYNYLTNIYSRKSSVSSGGNFSCNSIPGILKLLHLKSSQLDLGLCSSSMYKRNLYKYGHAWVI